MFSTVRRRECSFYRFEYSGMWCCFFGVSSDHLHSKRRGHSPNKMVSRQRRLASSTTPLCEPQI